MILLTPELRIALRANGIATRAAQEAEQREPDHALVLKLFNPCGAATWLATELDEDGDTLFGLADLGFGCPELGSFSLREIAELRLPLGLGIEPTAHSPHRTPCRSGPTPRGGSVRSSSPNRCCPSRATLFRLETDGAGGRLSPKKAGLPPSERRGGPAPRERQVP